MKKPTAKEIELKALINSLTEYANEAVKISATKSIGLGIINSLNYSVLSGAQGFFSRREDFLKTSYTNKFADGMEQELDDYLKAAKLLVKAKDSLDSSFEIIKQLKEVKNQLKYIADGYFGDFFCSWDSEVGQFNNSRWVDAFNNRWIDVNSVEAGFKCLKNVLSAPDLLFCVTISGTGINNLLNEINSLIRKSVIERKSMIDRYIEFEGLQASETDKEIWRNIYRHLKAIREIIKHNLI